MRAPTYTADQVPAVARELIAGRTVIHVVPATDNHGWAAMRTWEFAKSAASGERRVALIDLSLESPVLDLMAQNTTEEGIVDAFLYGASLSHVARQQDVPSLYYVGVGTRTNEPAQVWASRRWERLARGFRNEKAVLIAYVPPGALNRCALEADGMLVLAPNGYDPALDVAPGIARKLKAGTPLIGVVSAAADLTPEPAPKLEPRVPQNTEAEDARAWDISVPDEIEPVDRDRLLESPLRVSIPVVQPTSPVEPEIEDLPDLEGEYDLSDDFALDDVTPPVLDLDPQQVDLEADIETEPILAVVPPKVEEEPAAPSRPSIPTNPYDGPRLFEPSVRKPIGNTLFLIGSVVAVAVVVVFGYTTWTSRDQTDIDQPIPPAVEPAADDPTTVAPVTAAPPPPSVKPLAESDSLYYAVQTAALNTLRDAMEHGRGLRRGNRPVTVSPVRIGGRIWYRVIVGAYATPEAADEGRRSLWQDGLVERGEGTILRTPQAFSLGRRDTMDSARAEASSLWDRGVPAYVLPHDGGGIVAVGAFVRPEQASIAESMLTAASLATSLAPRMGSTQ